MNTPIKDRVEDRNLIEIIQAAIEKHGKHHDALIPILSEINAALGYISADAIKEMKKQLHNPGESIFISESQLFSMASFYHMLATKPRGKHVVKFCESAPCHVVGGRLVWQALKTRLGLKNGETSPDGNWTLVTTSCLGICSVGPVLLVDDDIYGNVTAEEVNRILDTYQTGGEQ